MFTVIARAARQYLAWYEGREACHMGLDKVLATAFTRRQLERMHDDVIDVITRQTTELQIQEKRLSERYDLGMALNEAAARVIKAKGESEVPQLSATQQAALRHQKDYLERLGRQG